MLLLALLVLQVFAPAALATPINTDNQMRFQIDRDAEGQAGGYVDVRVAVTENVAEGWFLMTQIIAYDPALLTLVTWEHPFMPAMPREPVAGNHNGMWAAMFDFDAADVPIGWTRNVTLTAHGAYQGGGVFENGVGTFVPASPIVGMNYVSTLIAPASVPDALGRTDEFFIVFRFRINENAQPGDTADVMWEFTGATRGTSTPGVPGSQIDGVAAPRPEEQGLVTVIAPPPGPWTASYAAGTGGTGSHTVADIANNTAHTVLSPEQAGITGPADHDFAGWRRSDNNQLIQPGASLTMTGNVTLTAEWTAVTPGPWTVSYAAGTGGTGSHTVPNLVNNTVHTVLPADAAGITGPAGQSFAGWRRSDNNQLIQPDALLTMTGNVTLTAEWTTAALGPWTVSYAAGAGGTGSHTVAGIAHNTAHTVLAPTAESVGITGPDGQNFAGWRNSANNALVQPGALLTMTGNVTLTAEWLDPPMTPDAVGFLMGFPDGTIRPQQMITRAEMASIFFRLVDDDFRADNWTITNGFDDVNAPAWFNNPISVLANAGVFGEAAGNFRPNEPATRGEFAMVLAWFVNGDIKLNGAEGNRFDDIDGHPAAAAINRLFDLGWVQGDGSGRFNPDGDMNRAYAARMMLNFLGRSLDSVECLLPAHELFRIWPDNDNVNAWYFLYIQEATHTTTRNQDGSWAEIWNPLNWTFLYQTNSNAESIQDARYDAWGTKFLLLFLP